MKATAVLFVAMALVLAASAASADPRHHRGSGWHGERSSNWKPGWGSPSRPRYYPRPSNAGEAFWGGVVGGVLGNIFTQEPAPPPPVVVQGEPSVAWCIATYRSYNLETGTYTGFDGRTYPCP
jgi:hypothetical protein